MTDPLGWLARRVEDDSTFLAPALVLFARSEGLDEGRLAAALGCTPEVLVRLKLCRPPRPGRDTFWGDVCRLAGRFGLDPDRLAEVARRGQAIQRFAAREAASPEGTLLAARDGERGEGPSPGPPPEPS